MRRRRTGGSEESVEHTQKRPRKGPLRFGRRMRLGTARHLLRPVMVNLVVLAVRHHVLAVQGVCCPVMKVMPLGELPVAKPLGKVLAVMALGVVLGRLDDAVVELRRLRFRRHCLAGRRAGRLCWRLHWHGDGEKAEGRDGCYEFVHVALHCVVRDPHGIRGAQ